MPPSRTRAAGRWRRLRRSPVAWWLAAIGLALGTGDAVQRSVAAGETARRQWGRQEIVAVVQHPLAPGDVIEPGDVELHPRPVAVVPDGALSELLAGRVVVAAMYRGEVVVASRLAPAGLHGVAALLPTGTRALAVPVAAGGGALSVTVGDLVDVLATFDTAAAGDAAAAPTFPVAQAAIVVAVSADAVTVAVPAADAARVAFALSQGQVVLALIGRS